ncbi:MAG: hypothetical protein ABIA76_02240 [Candidatus Diapherotrites archaeon]
MAGNKNSEKEIKNELLNALNSEAKPVKAEKLNKKILPKKDLPKAKNPTVKSAEKNSTAKPKGKNLTAKKFDADHFMLALIVFGLVAVSVVLLYSMHSVGVIDLEKELAPIIAPKEPENPKAPVIEEPEQKEPELKEKYFFEELMNEKDSLLGKEFIVEAYLNRTATCPRFVCSTKPCCNDCFESIYLSGKEKTIEELTENEFIFILGVFEEKKVECSGNKCNLECNPDLFIQEQREVYDGLNAGIKTLKVKLKKYSDELCPACDDNEIEIEYYLELIEVMG